jgi:hypothetical protein
MDLKACGEQKFLLLQRLFKYSKIIFKTWHSGIISGHDTDFIFKCTLTPKFEIILPKTSCLLPET